MDDHLGNCSGEHFTQTVSSNNQAVADALSGYLMPAWFMKTPFPSRPVRGAEVIEGLIIFHP
jgi:hypothetical protein